MSRRLTSLLWFPVVAACSGESPAACTESALRAQLSDIHLRNPVPGLSAAITTAVHPDSVVAVALGRVGPDSTARAITTRDRLLAGSVGKMFWAALALRRHATGQLALDAPLTLAPAETGIPSFAWITPRMLLLHTSGLGEYDGPFMQALVDDPRRPRERQDWLDVIRRNPPTIADTGRFRYSDLNYVVLAMVLDGDTAGRAYREVAAQLTGPLGLHATIPSTTPRVDGLIGGFEGAAGLFGRDAMLAGDTLIYNPQFEWGGGGFASTPGDLARWMVAYRTGAAFPDSLWAMVAARPAGTPDTVMSWRGIGVHRDSTGVGVTWGHSGYMPGYVSWVRWYDRYRLAAALQTNATDTLRLREDGFAWLDSLAAGVHRHCSTPRA